MGKFTKRKSNERSFARCENSHSAKISHDAKIWHPSAKLLDFPAFFAHLSFWFLFYNVEFDSNSMCLDRLDNLGIISLQKLQN